MSEIDFLNPGIQQIRHSIKDIDDSYNHNWDVLAELCQNAVDAIRMSDVERGIISLEVDCIEKSIKVTDNGNGITPDDLPTLLKPFATGKEHSDEVIGEKGVGLTFVMFSCNSFYIKSGTSAGTSEGRVTNAYAWKNGVEHAPLLLEHSSVSEPIQGTIVHIKAVENPCIFNLKAKQLIHVLRTKTALGNTRIIWGTDKDINITLKFKDQDGEMFEGPIPFKYWLPIEDLPQTALIDLDEFIRWAQADRTDHEKRQKLKDRIISRKGTFTHTDQRTIKYFTCFVPKRATWNMLSIHGGLCTEEQTKDDAWVESFGFTRFEQGIYTSVKGMPTGITVDHPAGTGWAGYWSNLFIIFEDARLKFDIGRKAIHGRQSKIYKEQAKRIFNDYLKYVTKFVSGEVEPTIEWDRDEAFAQIENLVDLNVDGIRFKKNPQDQEASVAAIFFECIGNGRIRNITPLCSGYRSKYDLYAMWGNKKLVLEFKSKLSSIIRDFDDAQKMFNEINGIVCWEVTDSDIQAMNAIGITVERIQTSPLTGQGSNILPHATHTMLLSGFIPPIYVIDLKLVLVS
jgi:hypothetical protein